jgi:hypothetical protein
MALSKYSSSELHPRKLDQAEAANPYLLIQRLFDYGHLPEMRQLLIDWFKANVTSSYNKKLNNQEHGEISIIYEWMEKLLKAAHVILVQRGGWCRPGRKRSATEQPNTSAEQSLVELIKLTKQPESIFRFRASGSNAAIFIPTGQLNNHEKS